MEYRPRPLRYAKRCGRECWSDAFCPIARCHRGVGDVQRSGELVCFIASIRVAVFLFARCFELSPS